MLWRTRKSSFIFTNKKNPEKGIMSTVLGIISAVSICIAIYLTYKNDGMALMQYGVVVLLSIVYSCAGVILGILSYKEQDIYKLFPVLGLVFNIISIIAGGIIVCQGLM